MANNYVQFSFAIHNLTPEEKDWLKEESSQHPEDMEDDALDLWVNTHPWCNDAGSYPGFKCDCTTTSATLYAEECGDIANVAGLVQEFLKKFRPRDAISFTWSETCDRMRVDQFGGGAACISATEQRWLHTHSWAMATVAEMRESIKWL